MAKVYTYGEIVTKLQADFDIANETIIGGLTNGGDEMVGYANEAIEQAEAEIHRLGAEDEYFLKKSSRTITQGSASVPIPTDIYANKIRGLVYVNGSIIYPIRRMRRKPGQFINYAETLLLGTSDDYQYLWVNDDSNGPTLTLYPPARETGAYVDMWYIREASRVPLVSAGTYAASAATKIDIPEFTGKYIYQYMRMKVAGKIKDPGFSMEKDELAKQLELMVSTLTGMVPDDDDTIVQDTSHYHEMS